MTQSRPTEKASIAPSTQDPAENESIVLEVAQAVARKKLGRKAATNLSRTSIGHFTGTFQCDDQYTLKVTRGMRALRAFEKEVWCIRQAARLGVHVPKVVEIGREKQFAYWLAEKVQGTSGVEVSIDYQRMWKRLGEYSRNLSSIRLPAFGKDFRDEESKTPTWSKWVEFEKDYLFTKNESFWLELLSTRELETAKRKLIALSSVLAEPMLANGDITETNTVVDPHGNVYLVDWDSAGGFPGYWDLAQVCAWHEPNHASIRSFCDGYGLNENNFLDLRPSIESIQTWRWLSSILWAKKNDPDNWLNLDYVKLSMGRIKEMAC